MAQHPTARVIALVLVVMLAVGSLAVVASSRSASSDVVTTTLSPVADAYVESTTATTNYGASTRLVTDASPDRQILMRYDLSGLPGALQSAKLRIHVSSATDSESPSGGSVAWVNDSTWSETGVTYSTRPTTWGSNVAALGAVSRNTWVEVTVTGAVTSGGVLTLGIRSTDGDGAYFDSRESGANAPQLVVSTSTPDAPTSSSSSTTSSSTSSTTTTTTTAPTSVTTTVTPVADAYVDSSATTTHFGTNVRLVADSSPTRQVFMRFDLSGATGAIQSAKLRLHVTNVSGAQSTNGGSAARVTETSWTEAGLTYSNRPTAWGTATTALGAVTRNTWVEATVTSLVTTGSTVTIGIRSSSSDETYYDSRESGATVPQLVVVTGVPPTTTTSSSTTTTTTTTVPPGESTVIAAAGDMVCPPNLGMTPKTCRQIPVSNLVVNDPAIQTFLALGDLQYDFGEPASFMTSYEASYGRVKAKTRPTPGNHEYGTPGATGYYGYFGAAAGDPAKGYYSFDVGSSWHIVMLNGNCDFVSCSARSTQTKWLAADLVANTRPCVISAWHQPRFSSGLEHGNDTGFAPFWDVLQQYRVDIVLNGHDHSYERFDPQLPSAAASPDGMREFVVGTGGRSLYGFAAAQPNSAVRLLNYGILELTLGAGTYSWQFVAEDGSVLDRGAGTCH